MTQGNPAVIKFDALCTLLLQESLSRKNGAKQRAVKQAFVVAAQRKGGNSNVDTSHGSSARRVVNLMFLMLLLAIIHLGILVMIRVKRRYVAIIVKPMIT